MPWPTMSDFQEAIQNPPLCFADPELRRGSPELNAIGLPRPITGAFASVYQINCGSKRYAVRCFLRYHPDQEQRYATISDYLARARLPYMADFSLLQRGIRVRGDWYPILKMEWLDGLPLNTYIERHLNQPSRLRHLADGFGTLVADLRAASLAHGDLQHGNILVVGDRLRLVDYDGMFVPGLEGMISHEVGHRNYQHPCRTEADFGPHIDHFSSWVIALSLAAVSAEPGLWNELDAGDECLLFRDTDFANVRGSAVMARLEWVDDETVRRLARTFPADARSRLVSIPALDGMLRGSPVTALQRAVKRWWVTPDEPPPVESAPGYSGADWVLDYIDPAPQDEPPPETMAERVVISLYCVAAYLIGMGAFNALLPLLAAAVVFGVGTLTLGAYLAVQYARFPEVREKRRLLTEKFVLRARVRLLLLDTQQFDTRRRRLDRDESAMQTWLDHELDKVIAQALVHYPVSRKDIPELSPILELRLRLFGVRTAADVAERRIARVNGMDDLSAQSLLRWRATIEQRVRSSRADDWYRQQKAAIRNEYAQKRRDLAADEAANRQAMEDGWRELDALDQALRAFDNVTFVEYARWIIG